MDKVIRGFYQAFEGTFWPNESVPGIANDNVATLDDETEVIILPVTDEGNVGEFEPWMVEYLTNGNQNVHDRFKIRDGLASLFEEQTK